MIILIAVTEKQVVITDSLNPTPISGRQAIFARVNAPTQTGYDISIVGVYSTLETAAKARELHAKDHPGRKYIQKVAELDDNLPEPIVSRCIRCNVETPGLSYCPKCQKEHWAELRANDPEFPTEAEAPIRTTFGPGQMLKTG